MNTVLKPTATASTQHAPITAQLVARAAALSQAPLTGTLGERARQCVLDWAGVALAGSREPLSHILLAQAVEDGGAPIASFIGAGRSGSVRQAALLNGAVGHALDYDDANVAAHGHVTAAVLPAALALAQARGASGADLLRAFVAGYEMVGMVGQYVGRAHYERGFHATGTLGGFGAACAAAQLLNLDPDTTAMALGIAATRAGGQKAQFGTMCKPLHAGNAAENGVVGAQLAARGFTAHRELLEAPQGFAAATSPDADARAALAEPPGGSHLHSNLFKYHAACYGTHASIEAVRALCSAQHLSADAIECIELDVEPAARAMCNIERPQTGLQAKFSLRLNAALAVLGEDTSAPATYCDVIAVRPDVVALGERVRVRFMQPDWPPMTAVARIRTRDGRVLQARHDSSRPATDLPLQRERLVRKFMALAVPVVGTACAQEIERTIGALDQLQDVGPLMLLLSQAGRAAS